MGMGFPRHQRVSDLLHEIAELVDEADQFLTESALSPIPFAKAGKRKQRPKLSPMSFSKVGKRKQPKNLFMSLMKKAKPNNKPKPKRSGLQPHQVDRITNRLRNFADRIDKKDRDVFRAKRERKQRDRYNATKDLVSMPQKSFGTRMRQR